MEDILLGQARGLLILADSHKNNKRLCLYYLYRAKSIIDIVEGLRSREYVQKAA